MRPYASHPRYVYVRVLRKTRQRSEEARIVEAWSRRSPVSSAMIPSTYVHGTRDYRHKLIRRVLRRKRSLEHASQLDMQKSASLARNTSRAQSRPLLYLYERYPRDAAPGYVLTRPLLHPLPHSTAMAASPFSALGPRPLFDWERIDKLNVELVGYGWYVPRFLLAAGTLTTCVFDSSGEGNG